MWVTDYHDYLEGVIYRDHGGIIMKGPLGFNLWLI